MAPQKHAHEVFEAKVLVLAVIAVVFQCQPVIQLVHELLSWHARTAAPPAPHLKVASASRYQMSSFGSDITTWLCI